MPSVFARAYPRGLIPRCDATMEMKSRGEERSGVGRSRGEGWGGSRGKRETGGGKGGGGGISKGATQLERGSGPNHWPGPSESTGSS
jgi:hypothetical protein